MTLSPEHSSHRPDARRSVRLLAGIALVVALAACERDADAPTPAEEPGVVTEPAPEELDSAPSPEPITVGRTAPSVGAMVTERQSVAMDVEVRRGVEGAGGDRFRQVTTDDTSKETVVLGVENGAVIDAEITYMERASAIERSGHRREIASPLVGRTYRIEVLTEAPDPEADAEALDRVAAEVGAVRNAAGVWLDVFYPKREEAPTLDAARQELERASTAVVSGAAHGAVWSTPQRDRSSPAKRDRIRRDRFLRPDASPMPTDRVHPPAAEVEAVVRDNPSIGRPNPMHAMLPEGPFDPGVPIELDAEAVARFFGNGRAEVTVEEAVLTLDRVDTEGNEVVFDARFAVISREPDTITMRLALDGELAVTLDAGWLTRVDLTGTVTTDAMQPVDGEMTRLHSEGTVTMTSRASYGEAPASRVE